MGRAPDQGPRSRHQRRRRRAVIERCAAQYCAELPAPRPTACTDAAARDAAALIELDHAILVHDGTADATAAALARRVKLFVGIVVKVPVAAPTDPAAPGPTMQIVVTGASTQVNGLTVTAIELGAHIKATAEAYPDAQFVLRVDQDVPYARVVELIDQIKAAGGSRISLATEK